MHFSRRRKWILGAYLLALLAVVGFTWRAVRKPAPSIAIHRIDVAQLNSRIERRRLDARKWPVVPETPQEWREYLTLEETKLLVPSVGTSDHSRYDPWTYAVGRANGRATLAWAEHPGKLVDAVSNSLGLRGDRELASVLPDLRVLVAGDSHTCGVCRFDETFSARLETALGAHNPGKSIEVLNAGNGGYTFYSYVGTLLRWRERKPQVIVVAIFAGNDFAEALPFRYFFAGEALPEWTLQQLELVNRALKVGPSAMAQGLYSTFRLQCMPQDPERAVEAGVGAMEEIRAIGEKLGTRLVVCMLPDPCAQTFDPPIPELENARAILNEAHLTRTLQSYAEDNLVKRLASVGIECVDMRPIFAAEPTPPFWRADLHMNLRGQELVAKALEPIVQRLLEAR
ncbi:MAG: SGNH/GDSL hydrolase family protein [Planctomycetota bacterium]